MRHFRSLQARGDFLLNLSSSRCYGESTLAGLLTLTNGMPLLRGVLPASPMIGPGLYAVVLGIVAVAVVLWNVSRLEQRLARYNAYLFCGAWVRLPLLGINPRSFRTMLRLRPVSLAIVFGTIIVADYLLWNGKWAREFWHGRLESALLRERKA